MGILPSPEVSRRGIHGDAKTDQRAMRVGPIEGIDWRRLCPGVMVALQGVGHWKRSDGGSVIHAFQAPHDARPRASAATERTDMLKLYYHPTPNSTKAALLLEELELPYEVVTIDIMKGEQHSPEFRKVNPNAKLPAITDDGVNVFDSHAILLYLAERHQRFLPKDRAARAATLSWLEFVATGLSPFSGQAAHFLHYSPEEIPYARNRYVREVERHYRVLDERLATSKFLAGEDYTIADIALFGWAASAGFIFGEKGLGDYPNVGRYMDVLNARPAVARALALKARHTFKADLDEQAKRAMFPQNFAA